ncbi:MAG: zinc-ribbon domain containing protein [Planctomycetota bacterium]|jgi:CxxC-x17-CxxC domain-containing protein
MEQHDQESSPFSPEEEAQDQSAQPEASEPTEPAQPEASEPAEPAQPEASEPAEPAQPEASEPTESVESSDAPAPAGEPVQLASAEPLAAEGGMDSEFTDKVIKCVQCGAEFVHTAAAQSFYKEKGFANEPKRCPACRKARKTQGGGGSARGGAARQMYPATCADCGKETEVPFKPAGTRPVYCLDCYRKRRGS